MGVCLLIPTVYLLTGTGARGRIGKGADAELGCTVLLSQVWSVFMDWTFVDDVCEWHADSLMHDQMCHFIWRIKVCENGKFNVNGSDSELCEGVAEFDSLRAAKAFCETSERVAVEWDSRN